MITNTIFNIIIDDFDCHSQKNTKKKQFVNKIICKNVTIFFVLGQLYRQSCDPIGFLQVCQMNQKFPSDLPCHHY